MDATEWRCRFKSLGRERPRINAYFSESAADALPRRSFESSSRLISQGREPEQERERLQVRALPEG